MGIEELDADDEPAAEISHSPSSPDTKYDGASSDNVSITVRDTVSASVVIAPTELDIGEGASDTYTVVLDSQTPDNVIITVNDPYNTDVTADPSSLTLTTINWDSAQTVMVTASHDNDHNNEDATVTHTAASTDAMYDGITVSDVSVGVTEDDEVLETVSFGSASHSVIEGESTTIKVILSADPQTSVSIPLTVTSGTGPYTSTASPCRSLILCPGTNPGPASPGVTRSFRTSTLTGPTETPTKS